MLAAAQKDSVTEVALHFDRKFSEHEAGEFARYDRVICQLKENNENYDARYEKLSARIDALTQSIASYMDKQTDLLAAFPDGDPIGHRQAHEAVIRRNNAIARVCEAAFKELAKWGLLGLVGWLIFHAWTDLLTGPK